MQLGNPLISSISLQAAIDLRPLTVAPSTPVLEALALMAKSSSSCILPSIVLPSLHEPRPSCVLVLSGTALVGLLTERDIVRFAASVMNRRSLTVADVMTPNPLVLYESDFINIFTVLNLFRQHRIRHLPILDDRSGVLGIFTPVRVACAQRNRIRQLLQPVSLLKWRRVEEVMTPDVIRATPTASLQKLAKLMDKYRVSCVVIVEENTDNIIIPVGIVTQRDIVQFQALEPDFLRVKADLVMSSPLFSLNPADSLSKAHQQMIDRRVRRLVVSAVATGALAGIVTQTSLLLALDRTQMYSTIEVLQQEVRQLQKEKVKLLENQNLEPEKQVQGGRALLETQTEFDRLLYTIAQKIRQSLNLESTLNSTVMEVRQLLGTSRVLIYRFDFNWSGTVVVESVDGGWTSMLGQEVHDPCFAKTWVEPYKNGRIQATPDIYNAGLTKCHLDLLAQFQVKANLVVPILQAENLWGLLVAQQCEAPRQWQPAEIEFLQKLATQVAIAIKQAELYEQAQGEIVRRQRIEESLQRERDFAAAVLDTVGSLVVVLDRQGRIVRFNKACQKITHYEFDEVKDRCVWDLFLIPDEVESVKAVFQKVMAGNFPQQQENYCLTKAGTRRLIAWSYTALIDRAGAVEYAIATGTDITERFQAEEALLKLNEDLEARVQQRTTDLMHLNQELLHEIADRQLAEDALRTSEQRFRAIFEQAAVGMVEAALDGRFRRVNQKFCDIVGIRQAELLEKTFLEITHPDDIDPDKQYVEQLLAGKIKTFSMEKRYLRPDGAIVWVNLTGALVRKPSGDPDYFIAVVEDIKDRKDAESELRHKSHDLANFSSNLKKLHRLTTTNYQDFEALFTDYLQTGCEIFRLPTGIIGIIDGKSYIISSIKSDMQSLRAGQGWELKENYLCAAVVRENKTITYINNGEREEEPKHPAYQDRNLTAYIGTPILVNQQIYGALNFSSSAGRDRKFQTYEREIIELMSQTIGRFIAAQQMEIEREQAEAALRGSQRFIQRIAESTPNILYLYDLIEQRNLYINGAITDILGYTQAEINKMGAQVLQNLMHPDDLAKLTEYMQRLTTADDGEILEIEYQMKHANGEWRWLIGRETIFTRTHENQPQQILGTATDITDRKLASEQLQQANEKLMSKVQELEQHNLEMDLLRDMNEFMQACMTVEEAYEAIATLIVPLFPGCGGGLFMINSSSNLVEAVAEWGTIGSSSTLFMPNECWGLRRGRVHFVGQQSSGLFCKHIRGNCTGKTDVTSAKQLPRESLCVPMMAQGETLGLLYLIAQKPGGLTAAKQQLAQTVSEHIALALANLQLRETLQQQSIRDSLTGLFNRRYMEESLERELRRCDRNGEPLGIIMIDVDHFKRFNDTFGHEAGDAVLRELGLFLQQNIRDSDIACRYGGEELMLILPEASLHDTGERAEQLREGIKQLRVQHRRQQLGAVTVSLGVACFPEHGFTGEAAIRAADAALYRAKKAGRDRVVTAG